MRPIVKYSVSRPTISVWLTVAHHLPRQWVPRVRRPGFASMGNSREVRNDETVAYRNGLESSDGAARIGSMNTQALLTHLQNHFPDLLAVYLFGSHAQGTAGPIPATAYHGRNHYPAPGRFSGVQCVHPA